MAHQPSEHQPEHVEPDTSPEVLQYSENTTPGSPERRHLEAQIAELGWSNLFELLPPGVAEAYEVICSDLTQLADELTNPPEDQDGRLRSLGTYIRTLHRLDQYRDEFGIWWGFPPGTRKDLNKLAQEVRTQGPLTPSQIERLLERWSEVEDESVAEFLSLVEDDSLGELHQDGTVAYSPDDGPSCLTTWVSLTEHGTGHARAGETAFVSLCKQVRVTINTVLDSQEYAQVARQAADQIGRGCMKGGAGGGGS